MKLIFLLLTLSGFTFVKSQQLNPVIAKIDTAGDKPKLRLLSVPGITGEKNHLIKSLIIPAGLVSYGLVALGNNHLKQLNNSTKLEIREDHLTFATHLDNYLQYTPAVAVYGLNAFGIQGKSSFRDRTLVYVLANAISAAFVLPLKKITKIQRPDGSGFNSFPSGHTTTAFAAAEFMRMEYKDASPWYGVAGYVVAATTAVLRLYNNKHWVSDVVAGAGFGMLSTKLAYLAYPSIKRKFFKNKAVSSFVMPFYQNSSTGLLLVYTFKH